MGYQIKALSPWNKVVCERILLGEDFRLTEQDNSNRAILYEGRNWPKSAFTKTLIYISLHLIQTRDLAKNSPDEIKNHDFLKGINFNNSLRTQEAPYRLKIMCDTDTSNFVPIDPEKP